MALEDFAIIRTIFLLTLTLCLLAATAGGAYYLFVFNPQQQKALQEARLQQERQQEEEQQRAEQQSRQTQRFMDSLQSREQEAQASPEPTMVNCTSNSVGDYTYTNCY